MTYHVLREATTLELDTTAATDVTLCVGFDHERADPEVGCPARITIQDVWFEKSGTHSLPMRIECDTYDDAEIESMCWLWLAREREAA